MINYSEMAQEVTKETEVKIEETKCNKTLKRAGLVAAGCTAVGAAYGATYAFGFLTGKLAASVVSWCIDQW